MVVTWFGRVELDPMRVPLAAAMGRGRGDAFAERLDAATRGAESAAAPEPAPREEPVAPEPDVDASAPEAAEPVTDAVPAEHSTNDAGATSTSAPAAEPALPARSAADAAGSTHADGQAHGQAQRPGAAKPGVAASTPAQPVLADALAEAAARAAMGAGANAGAGGAAEAAASTVRTAADRIAAAEPVTGARAAAPKTATVGYRTLTPGALRLDEQARDSVFKQILFRLHKDGGEMRLRLEPPELGELDLHLTVENGNSLRLSIATDRADLRDLLTAGLRHLERDLRESGLSIAHAEVHARSEHDRRAATPSWRDATAGGAGDASGEGAAAPRAHTGWFTAEGLDFWV